MAGTYYGRDDVDWLTSAVVALAPTCEEGETLTLEHVAFSGRVGIGDDYRAWNWYHGWARSGDIICGMPIKTGTFPIVIVVVYLSTNSEGTETRRARTSIEADLVVTGEDQGTECDREEWHHLHPWAVQQIADLKSAVETAQARADAAWKHADTAFANANNNKEINDSQANSIGQLWQRVLAIEAKIAEDEN